MLRAKLQKVESLFFCSKRDLCYLFWEGALLVDFFLGLEARRGYGSPWFSQEFWIWLKGGEALGQRVSTKKRRKGVWFLEAPLGMASWLCE